MKIVINYANQDYKAAQHYNTLTAYKKGNADKVIEYGPDDLELDFVERYSGILNKKRGGGYWLWKPYIINRTIQMAEEGDYIFYTDSGSYFINSMDLLISQMKKDKQSIMSFLLPLEEIKFTKRDIIEFFGMWDNRKNLGNQRLATFILLRKNKFTVAFFQEYLNCATHGLLITDSKSDKQPEDDEFIENRHDQSIFSMLCKKYEIPAYRDPSEFGCQPSLYHLNDDWNQQYEPTGESNYPQIMVSHRKKKPMLAVRFDAWLRRTLPFEIYKTLIPIRDYGANVLRKLVGKR